MFQLPTNSEKNDFLKKTEDERLKRLLEKKRSSAAIRIQSYYRGYKTRELIFNEIKYVIYYSLVLSIYLLSFS
jgi:hypothetical protein